MNIYIILVSALAMLLFGVFSGLFPNLYKKNKGTQNIIVVKKQVLRISVLLFSLGVVIILITLIVAGFDLSKFNYIIPKK